MHSLYEAALAADDAYSEAIRAAYGPNATRWDRVEGRIDPPEVVAAYRAKRAADEAWRAEMTRLNALDAGLSRTYSRR
jgi:hypothetical protein